MELQRLYQKRIMLSIAATLLVPLTGIFHFYVTIIAAVLIGILLLHIRHLDKEIRLGYELVVKQLKSTPQVAKEGQYEIFSQLSFAIFFLYPLLSYSLLLPEYIYPAWSIFLFICSEVSIRLLTFHRSLSSYDDFRRLYRVTGDQKLINNSFFLGIRSDPTIYLHQLRQLEPVNIRQNEVNEVTILEAEYINSLLKITVGPPTSLSMEFKVSEGVLHHQLIQFVKQKYRSARVHKFKNQIFIFEGNENVDLSYSQKEMGINQHITHSISLTKSRVMALLNLQSTFIASVSARFTIKFNRNWIKIIIYDLDFLLQECSLFSIVHSFESVYYPRSNINPMEIDFGDEVCVICLNNNLGLPIVQSPCCATLFHRDHLHSWLEIHQFCPYCRIPLPLGLVS